MKQRKVALSELADIARMFAGDALLPSQLIPPKPLTPERRLVLAVLEEAVTNLELGQRADSPKALRITQDARDWFLDAPHDDDDAFTFRGACGHLGWSAEAVLAALRSRGLLPAAEEGR